MFLKDLLDKVLLFLHLFPLFIAFELYYFDFGLFGLPIIGLQNLI